MMDPPALEEFKSQKDVSLKEKAVLGWMQKALGKVAWPVLGSRMD